MSDEYSVELVDRLREIFEQAQVHRPMHVGRYDPGAELAYQVTGMVPPSVMEVRFAVERFVGGGFAGQVYRAKILEIDGAPEAIAGLETGQSVAVKILVPPSSPARRFRDFLYKLGFQGPFALQSNIAAVRSGALWWKFIRRAARVRFGDERAVVDVLGTFIDREMGACGEISEWVDGRTWRFEVDDHLIARWGWKPGRPEDLLDSPEFRAKRKFMSEFVSLLHELGASELARQYEWWTCKSQPNVLKRLETGDDPVSGLTAVDFRAGLALLPVLPMSPGDVKLIVKGLLRGSLVQFDRGDLDLLWGFVNSHRDEFADMRDAYEQLIELDTQYRRSQIDVTHHHVQLLRDGKLWSEILDATVTGWEVRNVTDEAATGRLRTSKLATIGFMLLGLIPLLGLIGGLVGFIAALGGGVGFLRAAALGLGIAILVALAGKLARKLIGRGDYRRHYLGMLTSLGYLRRTARARIAETLIEWHRSGRMGEARAERIARQPWRFFAHLPLSVVPRKLHRFLTDRQYAARALRYIFVRPWRLFFNPAAREQWLREMVNEGQRRHMLTDEDAETILSQVDEPFIQKYLKSLAVHVCTLPVTQIVSVSVAIWYVATHPELSPREAWAIGWGIVAAFQLTPISPGSLVRGFYVLFLVLREKNFKDYNIAVFLGFFKYVGYLAFPIQMTNRYPALARFMAAHWATGAVRVLPVFGEHGALLEHGVFDLFYNYPLTVRRRMSIRSRLRKTLRPRRWHGAVGLVAGAGVLALADITARSIWGTLPTLSDIWVLVILVPVALGTLVTIGAGGASFARRVKLVALCALSLGIIYALLHAALKLTPALGGEISDGDTLKGLVSTGMWAVFLFTLFGTVSGIVTEINLPEPREAPAASEDIEHPKPQKQLGGDVGVDTRDDVVEQDTPTLP